MEESRGLSSQFLGNLSGRGGTVSSADPQQGVVIIRSNDPILQHAVSDAVKTMKYFGFLRRSTGVKEPNPSLLSLDSNPKLRNSYGGIGGQANSKKPDSKVKYGLFPPKPQYCKPTTQFEPFSKERDHLGNLLPKDHSPYPKKRHIPLSTFEMSTDHYLQKNTSYLEMASQLEGPKLKLGGKYFRLNPDANLRLRAHIAASKDNYPVAALPSFNMRSSQGETNSPPLKSLLGSQTTPKKRRHKSEISIHVELSRDGSYSKAFDKSPEELTTQQVTEIVKPEPDHKTPVKAKFRNSLGSNIYKGLMTRSFDATADGGLVLKAPAGIELDTTQLPGELTFKPIQAFSPPHKRRPTTFGKALSVSQSESKLSKTGPQAEPAPTRRSSDSKADEDVSFRPEEKLPKLKTTENITHLRQYIPPAPKTQLILHQWPDEIGQEWRSMPTAGNLDIPSASREGSLASGTYMTMTDTNAKVMIVPRKKSWSKAHQTPAVAQSPFLDGQLGTKFDFRYKSKDPIDRYFDEKERVHAEVKNVTTYVVKDQNLPPLETKSFGVRLLQLEPVAANQTEIDTMTAKDLEYLTADMQHAPNHMVQEVRAYKHLELVPMMTPFEIEQATRARVKTLGRTLARENIEDRKKRQDSRSKNDLDSTHTEFKGKAMLLS